MKRRTALLLALAATTFLALAVAIVPHVSLARTVQDTCDMCINHFH